MSYLDVLPQIQNTTEQHQEKVSEEQKQKLDPNQVVWRSQ
jgi:hypothetical protein